MRWRVSAARGPPPHAAPRLSHMAMRLRHRVSLLDSHLKLVASRTVASSLCNRCRRYASSAAYPEKIAVLGGGISGLASAYFINKEFPNSKITVHEANKDSGGWIQSRRVSVPGGDVLFEYGPRTLRPGKPALVTAQMVSRSPSDRLRLLTFIGSRSRSCRRRPLHQQELRWRKEPLHILPRPAPEAPRKRATQLLALV